MLKKILLLLFVAVFACGVASTALATPWGQLFQTDDKLNLLNLWISDDSAFLAALGLPAGWTYWQSDDGLFKPEPVNRRHSR